MPTIIQILPPFNLSRDILSHLYCFSLVCHLDHHLFGKWSLIGQSPVPWKWFHLLGILSSSFSQFPPYWPVDGISRFLSPLLQQDSEIMKYYYTVIITWFKCHRRAGISLLGQQGSIYVVCMKISSFHRFVCCWCKKKWNIVWIHLFDNLCPPTTLTTWDLNITSLLWL